MDRRLPTLTHRIIPVEAVWWVGIGLYVAVIYATAPFVSYWRKTIVEALGYGVYDWILWLFVPPLLAVLFAALRRRKGKALVRSLLILAATTAIFGWYMMHLKYPIERLHFAQYGLLGGLVFTAALRRGGPAFSSLLALMFTYLAGLGDEWIQFYSPNRVAEISDAALNSFAGLLGICLAQEFSGEAKFPLKQRFVQRVRFLQGTGALSVVLTLGFLAHVHGFGYRIESLKAGIFYSSFSQAELEAGQTTDGQPLISNSTYLDEGDRHLFQREFYCSNDFLAADGSYYRNWSHCWMENAVLVNFYAAYMEKHAGQPVQSRLERLDRKFADKVTGNPVVWSEETSQGMLGAKPNAHLIASRVKSTQFTETTFPEMLFMGLVAMAIIAWIGEQVLRLAPNEE